MIPVSKDILDAVQFFQHAFTIVLALALGEAFKQFIADNATTSEARTIHWDRLPALIFFLLLIFPFFHGMNRYFFVTYLNAPSVPKAYSGYLMFDGLSFMAESALFFAMSRALSGAQWQKYFWMVLVLLVIDSIWCAVALGHGTATPVQSWLILNAILAAVLLGLLFIFRSELRCQYASIGGAATAVITTSISYYYAWTFYFP